MLINKRDRLNIMYELYGRILEGEELEDITLLDIMLELERLEEEQ